METAGSQLRNVQESEEKEHDHLIHSVLLMLDDGNVLMPVDEEERKGGDSKQGKVPNKDRKLGEAYERRLKFYFSGEQSNFNEADFGRRFRMTRSVFIASTWLSMAVVASKNVKTPLENLAFTHV